MKNAAWKYILAGFLPLVVLLFAPTRPLLILALGQEILLRTAPVDPRDFFRGDYVELDYDVAHLPLSLLGGEAERGETLYVSLRPDEHGVMEAVGISREKPSTGSYLIGKVVSVYVAGGASSSRIDFDYGIGRFYLREGTGGALEEALRRGEVLAAARLLGGKAVLKELKIERTQ